MKKIILIVLVSFSLQSSQAMQSPQPNLLKQSLIQLQTKLKDLSQTLSNFFAPKTYQKPAAPPKPSNYAQSYILSQLNDNAAVDLGTISEASRKEFLVGKASGYTDETLKSTFEKENKKHLESVVLNVTTRKKDNKKFFKLRRANSDEEYHCGNFTLLSIQELRDATQDFKKINPKNTRGSFHVRDALVDPSNPSDQTMNPWRKWQVDIGALQAHPDFFDAVFQVSSNFNGLETIGNPQNLSNHSIGSYYDSRSQGPAASLSAIYGAILRLYFPFYDENKNPSEWRQTDTNYVNFLENFENDNIISVSPVGYATIKTTVEPTQENLKKVKIGFHENVQVFYGARAGNTLITLKDKPTQVINQVFTSALDFRPGSKHDLNNNVHEAWGKMLVTAAYEGTLRAAAMHGKKKVVLTLVGAGLFQNPKQWIVDALLGMQSFVEKAGLDVTIIGYGENDLTGIRDDLAQLVEATDGTYLPVGKKPKKKQKSKSTLGKQSTQYSYPNFNELIKVEDPASKKKIYFPLRVNFFKDVVGVNETTFKTNFTNQPQKYIRYDKDSNLFFIKNQEDTTLEFQCGRFELHRLEDLRNKTNHIMTDKIDESIPAAKRGRINVLHFVRDEDRTGKRFEDWEVDIGANQANPKFSDAVFQVASNYNALEFLGYPLKLKSHTISSYTGDMTQGPFASISAAPGTILRYYFPYFDTSKPMNTQNKLEWRQRTDKFVNMLEKFTDTEQSKDPNMPMTMTEAGYPKVKPTATLLEYEKLETQKLDTTDIEKKLNDELTALQVKIKNEYSKEILIGYQDSVQVTHGAMSYPNHIRLPKNHIQIINQVFTAAIDLGQNTNDRLKKSEKGLPILEMWAKEISKAVYEGTIRIAAMKGKTQLILTLVGCGAFGNKFEWVYNAIEKMENFIVNSGLQVTVIGWAKNDFDQSLGSFKSMIERTEGAMKSGKPGMSWSPN